MEQLYQDNPRHRSTYTLYKNRSFTDSLESYQHGAHKELLILRWNKRIPRIEVVLHFLKVLSEQNIKSLRLKIFRYLKEHNINAVATIELTRDGNGKPSNKVHIHILTDDNRRKHIIREVFTKACEQNGLVNGQDFRIDCRELDDGYKYFAYFTKYGYSERVILFRKVTRKKKSMQKFYEIGDWFRKTKQQIWEEVKAWLQKKFGTDVEKNQTPNYE
jgi:predicted GIY-YIG superfamily endonuclease